MSESGTGRPAATGTAEDDVDPGARRRAADRPPGRRGDRRWLWILLGVLGVAAVVVAILLLTNERQPPEPPPTLDPEIVTLPVPTPTVEPVELPEGTAFFEAVPRTVLQFAVSDAVEAPSLLRAGALEGYRFVYDDGGGTSVTLHASQWRSAEAAGERLAEIVAEQVEEAGVEPTGPDAAEGAGSDAAEPTEPTESTEPTDGSEPTDTAEPTDPATEPRLEQGPVVVDDAEVGSYLLRVREDGTARLWWTNATALFSLEGPADVLRDVYAGFPL